MLAHKSAYVVVVVVVVVVVPCYTHNVLGLQSKAFAHEASYVHVVCRVVEFLVTVAFLDFEASLETASLGMTAYLDYAYGSHARKHCLMVVDFALIVQYSSLVALCFVVVVERYLARLE